MRNALSTFVPQYIRNKIKGLTSPPSDNFGGLKMGKAVKKNGASHIVRKPGCSRTIRSGEAGK